MYFFSVFKNNFSFLNDDISTIAQHPECDLLLTFTVNKKDVTIVNLMGNCLFFK